MTDDEIAALLVRSQQALTLTADGHRLQLGPLAWRDVETLVRPKVLTRRR